MTPEDVKGFYKSCYRFNKETGMAHASLQNWLKWGFVPECSQYKLERLSGGKLRASWPKEK